MRVANEIKLTGLPTKRISLAIMVALGTISNLPIANAGPGIVCSDGTLPIAGSCATGTAIPTYYANSPKLRKFVDTLPGLTPTGANTFADGTAGSYIPVAIKDSISYQGSSYYELAVVEYTQKMHSDLQKATTLRGYIQIDRATTDLQVQDAISNTPLSLKYPDGSQIYVAKEKGLVNGIYDHTLIKDSNGKSVMVAAIALEKPHYLGPAIIAEKGVPTRIKMNNLLPKGRAGLDSNGKVVRNGDIFLPVDESLPGAGNSTVPLNTFPQNRVAIHLHGGDSPWISDGTPHQWFSSETDSAISPLLKRGDRALNVPDMPYPGEVAQTLFWPNDQSARLMWYHDHSFGLTRQNAYSGEAAPYLITDATEDALLGSAVPADMIPLIIQDKTFVANDIAQQDSKWDQAHWGAPGDLWYPHVYEPNVIDHDSNTGTPINPPVNNNAGRWDYGPTADGAASTPAVLALPDGSYGHASAGPEAYMDTAMVNGVAYPTLTVDPKAYRVRLLNGANDRYFNLSLWVADNTLTSLDGRSNTEVKMVPEMLPSTFTITNGGSGYVAPKVIITDQGGYGSGAIASAQVDVNGVITAVMLNNSGSSYANPQVQITDALGKGAVVSIQTIIGRPEGIPDPVNAGPAIIQFGNEAGLLPRPVIHSPKAMSFNSTTETGGGFYLANAERGDTVIDFSKYAGKTLILYNDSSAPVPDGDSRYDYFTGNSDQSSIGGSVPTQAGYGPNTRTVMQIKVSATSPTPAYDTTGKGGPLETILPSVYQAKADSHIEPGIIANGKFNTSTLADWKTAHPGITLSTKTIEGGFDINFGRLIANFGLELPGQNASTWLAYIDKTTDIVEDGKIQYWHIKNNDADNHPIHFHLFNVQVITRVDHATGLLINPNPNEAGWKETVQNWPNQDVIVALKPKSPALPFGLPDSVRLMDPTLNAGDTTNTSLDPNYTNAGVLPSATPLAFQQYDLVTGAFVQPSVNGAPGVVNDLQNFGWEYVYHCHILGHEENDLMRPMKFLPIPSVKPDAQNNFALDISNGRATWVDSTPINGADVKGVSTKGNPKNEIGFRIEYAPNINGVVNPASFTNAESLGPADPITTIPDNILSNNLLTPQKSKINSVANTVSFDTNLTVLTPNTDFVYRVVAVNQAGETPSATVPLAQAPAAVANLNASSILANSLTLTWTDRSNETGYVVEFSSDNGTTWQAQGTITANTTGGTISYPVTGLSQATTYLFRVGTIKTGFPTIVSPSISATTLAGILVSQPANLTATSPTAVGVTLTWTDTSNNETSFLVERATITNGNVGVFSALPTGSVARTKALGTAIGGLVTFQDATAIIGVSYAYHVKAVKLTGTTNSYSASSNVATITLALSAPTSFTGTQTAANIVLNWLDTSNNETGFQITRSVVDPISNTPIGTATLIAVTSTAAQKTAVNAARTYTDTKALPGITYSYSIASLNGTVSSTLVAMTPAIISMPINAPTLPTATITNATKISLAWTDLSTNETGFLVERSITVAGIAGPWTTLTTVAQKTGVNTAVSYADNLVAPIIQGSYQYRVTAINATGAVINGSSSPVISAPLDFTTPTAPSAVVATVTAGATGIVNLNWSDNASNETGFSIQRATNAAFTTGLVSTKIVGTNAAATFNYQLTGLKKGSVFYFRVQATNTVGVSSWATTVIPTTVP